jgi:hypothetical protein
MKSRRAKHADPYELKWSRPGDCRTKRQNKKHLNPAEQRELAEDIFGGKYSVDMWNEINALKTFWARDANSKKLSECVWEALYTIGCRLQEFESFVRRRFKELEAKSTLTPEQIKNGVLSDNDILRTVYGLSDKEAKSLRRSYNARKGKK